MIYIYIYEYVHHFGKNINTEKVRQRTAHLQSGVPVASGTEIGKPDEARHGGGC